MPGEDQIGKGTLREPRMTWMDQGIKVSVVRLGQAGICEGQQRAQCVWSPKRRVESSER